MDQENLEYTPGEFSFIKISNGTVKYFLLGAASLASRGLSKDLNLKMKKPKTITGPIRRLPKIEYPVSLVVIKDLSVRQKTLTALYNY